MKVLIISEANSSHTYKWVKGLAQFEFEICLWSLNKPIDDKYDEFSNVKVYYFFESNKSKSLQDKFKYLFAYKNLKDLIKKIKPDLLHAHYATSYGLLATLVKFKPFILSVWGSDVYDFPKRNFLFRRILERNLRLADKVLSTSHVMADETRKYYNGEIEITPFGVDTSIFKKSEIKKNDGSITIGCVKSLETVYGLDNLIRVISLFVNKHPNAKIFLKIVGGGSQKENLINLTKELNIEHIVTFVGKVTPSEVVDFHNQMDIEIYLSRQESFGVSVLEASSCEIPVIVADVGGLPEVVKNNKTGFVVDTIALENVLVKLETLYFDSELRASMGVEGRKWVKEKFDWNSNLIQMKDIYCSFKNK